MLRPGLGKWKKRGNTTLVGGNRGSMYNTIMTYWKWSPQCGQGQGRLVRGIVSGVRVNTALGQRCHVHVKRKRSEMLTSSFFLIFFSPIQLSVAITHQKKQIYPQLWWMNICTLQTFFSMGFLCNSIEQPISPLMTAL